MSGDQLRRIRKRLELTQVQMANRMGTTGNTIARWERGERSISGPAEKLARLLARIARESTSPRRKRR